MTLIGEQLEPRPALYLRLCRQCLEPLKERRASIIIAKKDNPYCRHDQLCTLAKLLRWIKEVDAKQCDILAYPSFVGGDTAAARYLFLGGDQPSYRAHVLAVSIQYHF